MFKKIIFCDGVDQAGKTTKIKQVTNADPNRFAYFRSNYQMGSEFAGKPVNLEESAAHDWRILFDFINQTSDPNKILFVDRGFLSSYAYSKAIRNTDLTPYLNAYLEMFKPVSEFWIFIRRDFGMKEQWEKDVNEEFKALRIKLELLGLNVKVFYRDEGNKFSTTDFSNLEVEVFEERLDVRYYADRLRNFGENLSFFERRDGILVSDLDGTLLELGYPKVINAPPRVDVINYLNSLGGIDTPVLIITGRERVEDYIKTKISNLIDRKVYWIWNNKNIGLSSTVLKQYCFHYLGYENLKFTYIDDREDVVQKIFPGEYTKNEKLNICEVNKDSDRQFI